MAEDLIAGHGQIVAEFFDTDRSRRLLWPGRPKAAALQRSLEDPDRGFDAVVVGEYERAFCGDQVLTLLPVFHEHGVQLWLPEAQGPVDPADSTHRALLMLLGAQSKREVLRARSRALAAMRAQIRDEGRYLGGRPLYGYRLVDAGPHPNRMHAKLGPAATALRPNPATAPTVRWIFAQRLSGRSVSAIAATLNANGIPNPSQADWDRNRHRTGCRWGFTTVRAILSNVNTPADRYGTANRPHHTPTHVPGPFRKQRWASTDQWVISKQPAHPALVSEADFVAAQEVSALPGPHDGAPRRHHLVGLLRCALCGRLESYWSHDRPAYRCQHGRSSTQPRGPDQRHDIYVRRQNGHDHTPAATRRRPARTRSSRQHGGSPEGDRRYV